MRYPIVTASGHIGTGIRLLLPETWYVCSEVDLHSAAPMCHDLASALKLLPTVAPSTAVQHTRMLTRSRRA